MTAPHVLLLAPADGATGEWVMRALARAGCSGQTYDYRGAAQTHGRGEMEQSIRRFVKTQGFDLVLALKGELISPITWAHMRDMGATTAIWYPDAWHGTVAGVQELANSVDKFFTPSLGLARTYREQGADAHWLPEACDIDDHAPEPASTGEPAMPVSFVGTIENIPDRIQLLTTLQARLGRALSLFGSYPGTLAGPNHHGRAEEYAQLRGDRGLAWVVGRTQINLDHQRNPELERTYGARIWRTLAMGGFLLTNHIRGIEQDFGKPGQYLDWYDDARSCLEKIRHYLERPEDRMRTAQAARRFVLEHHTFDHRVRELLRVCGKSPDLALPSGLVQRGP